MNCNQAEKSGNLCLGYSRSENDDEPCKQCLECHSCSQGNFQMSITDKERAYAEAMTDIGFFLSTSNFGCSCRTLFLALFCSQVLYKNKELIYIPNDVDDFRRCYNLINSVTITWENKTNEQVLSEIADRFPRLHWLKRWNELYKAYFYYDFTRVNIILKEENDLIENEEIKEQKHV